MIDHAAYFAAALLIVTEGNDTLMQNLFQWCLPFYISDYESRQLTYECRGYVIHLDQSINRFRTAIRWTATVCPHPSWRGTASRLAMRSDPVQLRLRRQRTTPRQEYSHNLSHHVSHVICCEIALGIEAENLVGDMSCLQWCSQCLPRDIV